MREIKFKGKRIDNGEWVYGFYFETAIADENLNTITGYFIHTNEGGIPTDFLIDPSTLGQYTGHENAYEGDIIRDEYGQFWEIFWDDIGHALRARCPTETVPLYWFDKTEFSDVVGNIHDNPELLEA